MRLHERAPPEVRAESVRPASEHLLAHALGAHPVRRHPGAEAANLLRERGFPRNSGVEQALRHRMKRVAEAVERAPVRLDAERGGIRMGGEQVEKLSLHLKRPFVVVAALRAKAIRSLAMHPGDDRTRWILHADRGRNRIEPHPRLRATVSRTHAVGLVAEAPGDDCLLALHAPDERAGEAPFPHHGFGVSDEIPVFDDARRKKRPGHPTGYE